MWWHRLAQSRAIPSARQFDVPIVHIHGDSLHEARNAGLARVDTSHVLFLDADDELEPGYLDHIDQATADIRVPAVRYVTNGRESASRVPQVAGHVHKCKAACLAHGNWCVIGCVAPTALVRDVGGFRDFAWSEDWDLWVRCWHAGATFEPVPQAVYRAHVRPDSRNRAPGHDIKHMVHQQIAEANGLPVPA